mmetsp:Transcript_1999/g.3552  ORF Transcript_1999/g.3552 Transcript_1999/m.3552 type:complete len:184 (+) Transcript_1999:63-614(+)
MSGVVQPLVRAVVVLNTEGKRICARYCDRRRFKDLESERVLETSLFKKMQSLGEIPEGEDIFEQGDNIVVYKQVEDVFLFVLGSLRENEIILSEALFTFGGALDLLLGGQVHEEGMLQNLRRVLLCVDELVDQEGIILENDPTELASRVGQTSYFTDSIPVGDQTLTQALQTARDQITRSILS